MTAGTMVLGVRQNRRAVGQKRVGIREVDDESLVGCVKRERPSFPLGEDDLAAILVVALDQQQALHAGVSLAPDDDVVVHGDAQPFARLDDLFRHLDVRARRRRIARRMVVHQATTAIFAIFIKHL